MATSKLHPFILPAEEYEHPQYPVRDESRLGPGEDLDREPDGVPHSAIALTALLAVASASASLFAWTRGDGIWIMLIATLFVILGIARWAARRRDHLHPSR